MKVLQLRTGCRLHFGLMELAANEPLQYAGLGLMLDQPGFELSFASPECSAADSLTRCLPSDSSTTVDLCATRLFDQSSQSQSSQSKSIQSDSVELKLEYERRMQAVADRYALFASPQAPTPRPPACHIRLIRALPMHSGLGAGTQLASAVATGLELFRRGQRACDSTSCSTEETSRRNRTELQASRAASSEGWSSVLGVQPPISTQWLTQSAGRGLRSAIGLYGFLHGGLILDEGYTVETSPDAPGQSTDRQVRPLAVQSTPVVSAWRVVLIVPKSRQSVSGVQEAEWMAELGLLPNPHRNEMLALAQQASSLASRSDRFIDFTHCLERYMELAGRLFSPYQGGLYNGEEVANAVENARRIGLRGIGQSSWGPTVFGFAESQARAEHFATRLSNLRPDWCVQVATPTADAAEYCWQ